MVAPKKKLIGKKAAVIKLKYSLVVFLKIIMEIKSIFQLITTYLR